MPIFLGLRVYEEIFSAFSSLVESIFPGRPRRGTGAKAAVAPFATPLRGILGDGAITLQMAGTRLRAIPGVSEAMVEQRLAGNGTFQRFLDLVPEFEVEGRAPKATVRLT